MNKNVVSTFRQNKAREKSIIKKRTPNCDLLIRQVKDSLSYEHFDFSSSLVHAATTTIRACSGSPFPARIHVDGSGI